jgi:hypothetical protein
VSGQPTQCDNNPKVGQPDEVDWWPKQTARSRNVVVVGGGVAGLEAAWVAAAHGHKVTLFSASAEAGGRVRLYSRLPGCEAVSSIFDYQLWAAKKAGVRFELSHEATAADLDVLRPDAVILASGGRFNWPEPLPAALHEDGVILDMASLLRELVDRPVKMTGAAVIFDQDGTDMTYAGAELLSHIFDRVVIVTPVECLARDQGVVIKQSIYRRMITRGVEIVPWSRPSADSRFEDGVFAYQNIMTGQRREIYDVQLFTYATPRAPRTALLADLKAVCPDVRLVGDARIACSTMNAVRDGHVTGIDI